MDPLRLPGAVPPPLSSAGLPGPLLHPSGAAALPAPAPLVAPRDPATSRDEAVSLFLRRTALTRSGSGHTVRAYQGDLARFTRFLDGAALDYATLSRADAARYLATLGAEIAPRSVQRRVAGVRTFYRFLVGLEVVARNPFDALDLPTVDRKSETHKVWSHDDVEEALALLRAELRAAATAYARVRTARRLVALFLAARRRAVFVVLVTAGLRRAELASLARATLLQDPEGFFLRVCGKGHKTREVPLPAHAYPALCDYLAARRLVPAATDALFVAPDGHPMAPHTVYRICAYLRRRTGSAAHALHPHLLRRTFATLQLDASHDLRAVQECLGHASIATTQIYTHVDRRSMRRATQAAPIGASEHRHGPLLTRVPATP